MRTSILFSRLIIFLVLACFYSQANSQVIRLKDSQGTEIVVDTRQIPVDEVAARSIARTIEIALPLAAASVSKFEDEKNSIANELYDHQSKSSRFAADQASLDQRWGNYDARLKPYNAELEDYKKAVSIYEKNKTQAEWSRLNNWKTSLDNKRAPLLTEHGNLSGEQDGLDGRARDLSAANSVLTSRVKKLKDDLGKAHEQLEQLYDYAGVINDYLKLKNWKVIPVSGTSIDGANEKIKEMAALGFDGNTMLQKLETIRKNFVATPNSN